MLSWTLNTGHGVIAPDERLPMAQTLIAGLQHAIVMFGATVLCPLLMGFDANVAIFFSGIGTLVFFVCVGGRVPSYLGSSFSFIGVVITITGYVGQGLNPNIAVALGGILAAGAFYAVIGLVVMAIGYAWVERLMPPAVTGAIVAVIGLNLAPVAIKEATGSALDTWVAIVTVVAIGFIATSSGGLLRRVPVLAGGLVGYALCVVLTNGLGWGKPVDFGPLVSAAWLGWPRFTSPQFDVHAMTLIAPVAIVLVAENLGHIKAISAMTAQSRPLSRPGVSRRWHRDDDRGERRRHRRHHLCREYRCDGSHGHLFDADLPDRGRGGHRAGSVAQIRCPYTDDPDAGDRRLVTRRFWADRGDRGTHLGGGPGRFLRTAQPRDDRGDPDYGVGGHDAAFRRVQPHRHRYRDIVRDRPLPAPGLAARTRVNTASIDKIGQIRDHRGKSTMRADTLR
jgi:hypothetical protein